MKTNHLELINKNVMAMAESLMDRPDDIAERWHILLVFMDNVKRLVREQQDGID